MRQHRTDTAGDEALDPGGHVAYEEFMRSTDAPRPVSPGGRLNSKSPPARPSARKLDVALICRTAERTKARIVERFPESGLGRVSDEVCVLAGEAADTAERLGRPYWGLRAVTSVVVLLLIVGAGPALGLLNFRDAQPSDLFTAMQGIDSGLQVFGVAGAGIFFLVTFEDRLKRRRALRALHELRSVIHVVDMHQLTKDPTFAVVSGAATPSSPARDLTGYELARYLDYCSELLSLCSKLAALYAQSVPDAVITDAVSDLERLTADLSVKIWQKIALIPGTRADSNASEPPKVTAS